LKGLKFLAVEFIDQIKKIPAQRTHRGKEAVSALHVKPFRFHMAAPILLPAGYSFYLPIGKNIPRILRTDSSEKDSPGHAG
jgi:hypothetical protein